MRPRCAPKLTALVGLSALLGARPLLAAAPACPQMTVEADANLRARWPELLPDVQKELAASDDLDRCAHVALSLKASAIGVEVVLPDGRTATRTAALREDVVPTLQALLLVPEPPLRELNRQGATTPPARTSHARPRPIARRARVVTSSDAADHDAKRSASELDPRPLGVELSLISGARIGDGQTSFGLGALSFLEVSGWLFGGAARADRYQALTGDSQEAAIELALLLGRRLQFSGFALDLSAGPAVAEKGIGGSDIRVVRAGTAQPPEPAPEESSGPVPRLLMGSRLGFSPRSVFRTFIGVDGALGPARVSSPLDGRAASLPIWTVGLVLGATLGTR